MKVYKIGGYSQQTQKVLPTLLFQAKLAIADVVNKFIQNIRKYGLLFLECQAGIITGLICATAFQSCRVMQSLESTEQCELLIQELNLQNLAVQQDFYSLFGVPLERSCQLHFRWCGTGWFQEQGQCFFIGLSCSIPTIVFYSLSLSLLSVSRLVLWGRGLRTVRVYVTLIALHC